MTVLFASTGGEEQPLQEDTRAQGEDTLSISSSALRIALPENIDNCVNPTTSDVEASGSDGNGVSKFLTTPRVETSAFFDSVEVDKSNLERACSEAHMENGMMIDLQQPWEKDVFATIFDVGESIFPKVERPEGFYETTDGPTDRIVGKTEYLSKPTFFESCVSFHLHKTKLCGEKEQLDLLFQRWEAALMIAPLASSLGSFAFGKDKKERLAVVSGALGGKSISTLRKRIGQLKFFLEWGLMRREPGHSIKPLFPLTVEDLRNYCMYVKDSKYALSRLQGWLECSAFMHHVLGMEVETGYYKDAYVSGVLRGLTSQRPRRKQARCFKVEEIKSLEAFLADSSKASVDRYAMGCVLFAIYARARFADLADVEEFVLDVAETREGWKGYLELRSASHKMRSVGDGLGLNLPLIAPVRGLGEGEWGMKFVEISSLVLLDIKTRTRGPLLPAPDKLGNWTSRCISTRETGNWYRSILQSMGHDDLEKLTPHGAKSTTLAQTAKFGVPESDRLILGHHKSKAGSSLDVYARDSQAAPLRKLEDMLSAIRAGVFQPDLTRSGMILQDDGSAECEEPQSLFGRSRFFPQEQKASVEGQTEQNVEHDELIGLEEEVRPPGLYSVEPEENTPSAPLEDPEGITNQGDSDSESSSSSDSSCSSIDDVVLGKSDGQEGLQDAWRPDCDVMQHRKSRTLHLFPRLDNKGTFVCGRPMNKEYARFEAKVFSENWKCRQCDSGKSIRSAEAVVASLDRALKKRKV